MNKQEFDVVVIGAGPSGIAAALTSLHYGLKVLLVAGDYNKKQKTIESIHPGVFSLLQHLKIKGLDKHIKLGMYTHISDGINSKSLNPFTDEIWNGYHISKNDFNVFLIEEATKQGLNIIQNSKANDIEFCNNVYTIATDSGDFQSSFIIDCSGNHRFIAKKFRLEKMIFSPIYTVYTGISSGVKNTTIKKDQAYLLTEENGWTWAAKLYNKDIYWTKLIMKIEKETHKNSFDNLINPRSIRAANMQWRIYSNLSFNRIFICGEAACLLDPASGKGILNAIRQGIKAAYSIKKCIEFPENENDIFNEYDFWLRSEFHQNRNQLKKAYRYMET